MITDTHSHLYWESFQTDFEEVLARARAASVSRMIVVGTNVATSSAAFEVCSRTDGLFPTAGIHPHDAAAAGTAEREEIARLAERGECVGIGETGLDYFKMFSPRERQRESFRWHLELARELGKPVIVHCRDAHEETVELLRSVSGVRGVMHCYTMGPTELPPYLELGFYISFSGVVTYPKNEANRKAAQLVPPDRLLVETDCPFLAPQGRRGKRNEPAFVADTLAELARARGAEVAALAQETSRNAAALFRLPWP